MTRVKNNWATIYNIRYKEATASTVGVIVGCIIAAGIWYFVVAVAVSEAPPTITDYIADNPAAQEGFNQFDYSWTGR